MGGFLRGGTSCPAKRGPSAMPIKKWFIGSALGKRRYDHLTKVPPAGLEPARPCGQRILSPRRLPIPPRWPFFHATAFVPEQRAERIDAFVCLRPAEFTTQSSIKEDFQAAMKYRTLSTESPQGLKLNQADPLFRLQNLSFQSVSPAETLTLPAALFR